MSGKEICHWERVGIVDVHKSLPRGVGQENTVTQLTSHLNVRLYQGAISHMWPIKQPPLPPADLDEPPLPPSDGDETAKRHS